MDAGHSGRIRYTERDAKMSGGGWWVEVRGEVQAEEVTLQERIWGAGDIKRDMRRL